MASSSNEMDGRIGILGTPTQVDGFELTTPSALNNGTVVANDDDVMGALDTPFQINGLEAAAPSALEIGATVAEKNKPKLRGWEILNDIKEMRLAIWEWVALMSVCVFVGKDCAIPMTGEQYVPSASGIGTTYWKALEDTYKGPADGYVLALKHFHQSPNSFPDSFRAIPSIFGICFESREVALKMPALRISASHCAHSAWFDQRKVPLERSLFAPFTIRGLTSKPMEIFGELRFLELDGGLLEKLCYDFGPGYLFNRLDELLDCFPKLVKLTATTLVRGTIHIEQYYVTDEFMDHWDDDGEEDDTLLAYWNSKRGTLGMPFLGPATSHSQERFLAMVASGAFAERQNPNIKGDPITWPHSLQALRINDVRGWPQDGLNAKTMTSPHLTEMMSPSDFGERGFFTGQDDIVVWLSGLLIRQGLDKKGSHRRARMWEGFNMWICQRIRDYAIAGTLPDDVAAHIPRPRYPHE